MFTLKKTFSILSMAALMLVACTPEDGDTGPIGPVGPEGAIGPAGKGDDGTDGTDGTDGVANIQTYTYAVDSSTWVRPQGTNYISNSITVNAIDTTVLKEGLVLVFETIDNSIPNATTWRAMPYTDNIFSHSYSVGPSVVNLFISVTLQGSAPTLVAAKDWSYKVVIIPPASKIAGFEPKTYEELQMVYGLKD
jgi:hypothetical protein